MMYDHEKSDPAIVAVKPTNKAGQPAAELVEPRAGAEGNVRQQSTGRAQYRGTVSQALTRISHGNRVLESEGGRAASRSVFRHLGQVQLTSLAGDGFKTNTPIVERKSAAANPVNYEDPAGPFSGEDNSIPALMLACRVHLY
jgi:hypothetical protein